MIRVLMITPEFASEVSGGIGVYVTSICKAFQKLKSEAKLKIDICLVRSYKLYHFSSFSLRRHTNVISHVFEIKLENRLIKLLKNLEEKNYINFNDVFTFTLYDCVEEILEEIKTKYDIIHLNDWYSVPIGFLLKKKFRTAKIIFSIHLPAFTPFSYNPLEKPFINARRIIEQFGLFMSDLIIAPSKYVRQNLYQLYNLSSRKIVVIHPGVDLSFFKPKKKKLENVEYRNEFQLITVARLTEQKGLDYAIEIAKMLNEITNFEFTYHIVGTGPLYEYYLRLIRENELNDIIRLHGFVDRKKLLELYQSSDIYLFTSVYEPFGISVVEAMACGNAVVGFYLGGVREIVRNHIDGILTVPASVRSLTNAVLKLLGNPQMLTRMKRNAYQRARMFDVINHARKLYQLYTRLV